MQKKLVRNYNITAILLRGLPQRRMSYTSICILNHDMFYWMPYVRAYISVHTKPIKSMLRSCEALVHSHTGSLESFCHGYMESDNCGPEEYSKLHTTQCTSSNCLHYRKFPCSISLRTTQEPILAYCNHGF